MRLLITVLLIASALYGTAQSVTKFEGGSLWLPSSDSSQGRSPATFTRQDFYVVDQLIRFQASRPVDTVIDLTGQYVIPPLGDAHTHNLDRDWQLSYLPAQYLAEGTFYVLNLTSKANEALSLRPYYAQDSTPDVRFVLQGWTSTLGHPFMAYEPFAMGLNDPAEWSAHMKDIRESRMDEGNSYIFADSVEAARAQLPDFLAQSPDGMKLYLVDSDQYARNSRDTVAGNNGLSPTVASYLATAAHEQGLRVYAHVDNAADLRLAVDIGVDCVAHVPGIGWDGDPATRADYFVADSLLWRAVRNDVAVITTVQWFADADSLSRKVALARDFLQRYHRAGGTLLIGSDRFGATLLPEWRALAALEVFTPAELLTIAASTTPRYIFPERNVGAIRDGYEADFLLLRRNPLASTEAILTIEAKYKAGQRLD